MNVTITLPFPPSVNRMWRTPRSGKLAGRTMLSAEGRAYRQAVADEVIVQRVPRHMLKGRLGVAITAHPPDRRARDLDNLFKAPLDCLQHAGVIRNDSDIDELSINRVERRQDVLTPSGGRITVFLWEREAA